MNQKHNYLYKAIEDTQTTIRFIETKSGLVLLALTIVVTFATNNIFRLFENGHIGWNCNITTITMFASAILALVSLIVAILISFIAIRPVLRSEQHVHFHKYNLKIPFYLNKFEPEVTICSVMNKKNPPKLGYALNDLVSLLVNATDNDIIDTLVFELAKLSYIRERKACLINKSISMFVWGIVFMIITLFISAIS